MSKALISEAEVLNYIPQRPPIVLVDRLLESNSQFTKAGFLVPETHLFVVDGRLQLPGLVENVAQTAALGAGYQFKKQTTSPTDKVPIGFIGAIKHLELYQLPVINTLLITSIELTQEVFNFQIVQAKIMAAKQLLLTCEMKIFVAK